MVNMQHCRGCQCLLSIYCFWMLTIVLEVTSEQLAPGTTTPAIEVNSRRVFCEIVPDNDEWHPSVEGRLMAFLFGRPGEPPIYNSHVRPKRNALQPIEVSVQLSLLSINALDDKRQELSTTGYILMEWNDDFLTWNPADFQNLTSIVVPPEMIWLPSDIGIENSANGIYQTSFRTEFRAIVGFDGQVTWSPGGSIATACILDVTYYPFDYQSCHISMSSWAYNDKQVHLTTSAEEINLQDYNINGEWHIVETKASAGVRNYGEPFSYVMFVISIQRKFYYHLLNILLPCALMSGLIVLVFILPAESGEKAGLGITILLSFSVFLLMIAESLPKTSESLPIIGFYMTFLLVASSTSLLLTVLSLQMHHATGEKIVPRYLRRILRVIALLTFTPYPRFSVVGKSKRTLSDLTSHRPPTHKSLSPLTKYSTRTKVNLNEMDLTNKAKEASPSVLRKAYLQSSYHSFDTAAVEKPFSSTLPYPPGKDSYKARMLHDALLAGQLTSALETPEPPPLPSRGLNPVSVMESEALAKLRESLAEYIEEINWKMRLGEVEELIKKDWRMCSVCLDHVCFRIFGVIVVCVSFTMCVGLPVVRELTLKNHW